MYKKINLFVFLVIISFNNYLNAQITPEGILFQAVAKDINGNAAAGRNIFAKVNLLKGTANGSIAYAESFKVVSSDDGIFTLIIGKGVRTSGASGLAAIDWDADFYFINIKIAIEPSLPMPGWSADSEYQDMGTSQLWSVPYALFASRSSIADSALSISTIVPSAKGGTGVNNNGKTISVAQNISFKGVGDISFSTTGASNISLPTTGLLANTQYVSDRFASDTISLSKRIDALTMNTDTNTALKLNIADTGVMLAPYFRKVDTINMSKRIDVKLDSAQFPLLIAPYLESISGVKYADTAAMLLPYARKVKTDSALALKLNSVDTAAMLLPYARKVKTDSALALKLNSVDTAAMLLPYATLNNVEALTNKTINGITPTVLENGFQISGGTITNTTVRVVGDVTIGGVNSGDQLITLIGDVSGSGTGIFNTTINSVGGIASSVISNMPTAIASNTLSITSNTTNIATNRSSITALDTRVATNTTNITAEITRATAAETTLDTKIATNTASITAEITRATNAENALDARVTNNTIDIATNRAGITMLDTRVTSNAANIATNTTDITTNKSDILSLDTRVTSNTASITSETIRATAAETALDTRVSSNTVSITTNTNDIATNAANIIALDARVTTNTASITTNTADIATNTAGIIALDTRVTTNTASITANANDIAVNRIDITTLGIRVASNTTSITANMVDIAANRTNIAALENRVSNNTISILTNTNDIATNTANITALDTRVTSNTASITTNINDIATNTANITALDTRVTSNTASITTNINDIATNSANITALDTRVTSNTASITTNTTNIATNSNSITALDTRVTSNTASITTNTTDIATNSNSINALDTRVTSNTARIITNTSDIATNTSAITTNTNAIATNTADITVLDTRVTSNTASITTNTLAIASNTASITTNTADITVLDTRVTSNTASITTNTTDIATNSNSIITLDTRVTSNTASITTNTADIATNTAGIITLDTRVTSNTASITTNTADIATNTAGIITLDTRVTSNTSNITAETTRATAAETDLDVKINANTASITTNTIDLATKAPINSPSFTGIPIAPTAGLGTRNNQIATTEFVNNAISGSSVDLSGGQITGVIPVANGGTGQSTYTDGQLLIGNSAGNTLAKSTLTAGAGVSILNGNGAITISATGSGGTVSSLNPINITTSGSSISSSVISATSTPQLTMNIPMATYTSTTGGLLSNADYVLFKNKQTALSAGSGISLTGTTIAATGLTTSNLSGSAGILNAQLANSSVTLGTSNLSLGGTYTSLVGLTSISSTGFTGALTGNASTATALQTSRSIYGNNFDGTTALTGLISTTYGGTGTASATQNFVFAGPATGATAGAPSFRALVPADLPASSGNYIWNGTALQSSANFNISGAGIIGTTLNVGTSISAGTLSLTNALSVVNGGTGANSITGLVKGNGIGAMTSAIGGTDYLVPNASITGGTKTKITFDAKGLITSGTDATTADITESANKKYVTDAQSTILSNTSGTNTGDQTFTLTGDLTGTGTGTISSTIANGAVSYAKMQNMPTKTLLGNKTTTTSTAGPITLGAGLSLSDLGILSATGTGGTVTGTGTVGEMPFWSTATGLSSTPNFIWDNTNKNIKIGENVNMTGVDGDLPSGVTTPIIGIVGKVNDLTEQTMLSMKRPLYNGTSVPGFVDFVMKGGSNMTKFDIRMNNFTNPTTLVNVMTFLTPGGYVGINNAAPTEKLDVTGNIRFSGALKPNNLSGTAGQFLTSQGAGTPTWTTPSNATASNNGFLSSTDWTTFNNKFSLPALTSGSVLFSNGTTLTQDNTNLFWDNTNNRLGLLTSSPQHTFQIGGETAENLKFGLMDTYYNTIKLGYRTTGWALRASNNSGVATDLLFSYDDGTTKTDRMTIGTTGGIAIPGTLNVTGAMTAGTGNLANLNVNNGKLYYNATNDKFGVFTSAPTSMFQIGGDGNFDNPLKYDYGGETSSLKFGFRSKEFRISTSTNSGVLLGLVYSYYNGTTNTESMRLGYDGLVSIGNLSTSTFKYSGGTPGLNKVLVSDASGNASWSTLNSVSSVGPISGTSNANGATITSGVLNLTPADETNGGLMTTGDQLFSGNKRFLGLLTLNDKIQLNFSGAAGGGVEFTGDGDIADNNDGYATVRFTNGLKINNAKGSLGTTTKITLGNNGNITAAGTVESTGFKLTGGTPGLGKVLVSDANGLASWTTPSTGIGGSGTAGYVPKFNASTTVLGNSNLYDDGTSLFVNSTSGSGGVKFVVNSGARLLPTSVASATTQTGAAFRIGNTSNDVMDMGAGSNNGWIQVADKLNLASNYSLLLNPNGGNVGIGMTTNPTSKLQVNGDIAATSINGLVVKSNGSNVVLGQGNVLASLSTGANNVAVGQYTLNYLETGSNNLGMGYSAMYNTRGSNNVGLGHEALYTNNAGNYNTAVGHSAGYANTGSNNTFLGYQSNSSGAITNATAIGNGATVTANNTIQLGNASVTEVKTSGVFSSQSTGTSSVAGKFVAGTNTAASTSAVLEANSTTQGFLPPRMTLTQRDAIASPVKGLIIMCSDCGVEYGAQGEVQVYNGTAWRNIAGTQASGTTAGISAPAIGSNYEGGVVAYILAPGDAGYEADKIKGFVVAASDVSYFGRLNGGTNIAGITNTDLSVGGGLSNFEKLVAAYGTVNTGGTKAAYDYTVTDNGITYDDWYIPSRGEFLKLYANRVAIGVLPTSTTYYWTSNQCNGASTAANYARYSDGFVQCDGTERNGALRLIRNFVIDPQTSITATNFKGTATKATNISGGVAGAIPYQTAAGATSFSAAGNTGQIFTSNGASSPTWVTTLPIANGGTGSSTKNFIDLSTTQAIDGLKTFTTGIISNSVMIGKGAGQGSENTAVGNSALGSGNGSRNTALGYNAMNSYNGTGFDNNTSVGYANMSGVTTGTHNTSMGAESVASLGSGSHNTAIGNQTLRMATSSYNTVLGASAGNVITTGDGNTIIGRAADVSVGTLGNATAIGYGTIVSASNTVRIGNTSITSIGGQVAWTAASDARIKKNIVNSKYGLETVLKLRPVEYNLLSNDLKQVGFIAQEVQKLVPEVVTGKEGDISKGEVLGITYSNLVPVLAKSIQELNAQKNEEIAALKIAVSNINSGESLSVKHLKGTSVTPVIEAAEGSGSSATVKITGTDMSGVIEIITGDATTANAVLASIQYSTAYSGAPVVIITPGNAPTASLMGTSTVFVGKHTNINFTLNTNATPLATKTTYKWYYQVIQ